MKGLFNYLGLKLGVAFVVLSLHANGIDPPIFIDSFSYIPTSHPDNTLFLFDIDDTLFDFPYMLGSKAWRQYIRKATNQWDNSKNWHDTLTLFLAQKHPIKAVEEETSQWIKRLQNRGYIVCGFTSRQRNVWYETPCDRVDVLTVTQLESIGIHFDEARLNQYYPHLTDSAEYFKGTFFSDCDLKGDYLLKLFHNMPNHPEKVVFIDDKFSQCTSVASALTQLGIAYEIYCYTRTDAKAKTFNPLQANIQLYYFFQSSGQRIVSDEEAVRISLEDDAKDYLNAIKDFIMNHE